MNVNFLKTLKLQTELRIVALVLFGVAVGLIVISIAVARDYHPIFDQTSRDIFRTESYRYHFMVIFRDVFFVIFPCVAALNVGAAWKLTRYAKRIQNSQIETQIDGREGA
jgi:hypothetical protein